MRHSVKTYALSTASLDSRGAGSIVMDMQLSQRLLHVFSNMSCAASCGCPLANQLPVCSSGMA
jgi:hypothetical protein